MRKTVGILIFGVALAAASFGARALSDSDSSAASVVTVHIKDSAFAPQALEVKVGQTVVFNNEDDVAHNVTDNSDKALKSGDIGGGKSWKYTFTQTGEYSYLCTYHPWMKGKITVIADK